MPKRTDRYVAMLRGVNIGARNRISMPVLRETLESIGCLRVTTYLQSGNALFDIDDSKRLDERISAALLAEANLDVPVLLRSATEIAAVISANPFVRRGEGTERLHLTFLQDTPSTSIAEKDLPKGVGRDEFELDGKDVYLCCSAGYSDSKLSNAFFERRFDCVATTRNWRTVIELGRLVGE